MPTLIEVSEKQRSSRERKKLTVHISSKSKGWQKKIFGVVKRYYMDQSVNQGCIHIDTTDVNMITIDLIIVGFIVWPHKFTVL